MRAPIIAVVLATLSLAGGAAGEPGPSSMFRFTSTWAGDVAPTRLWIEQGPQQFPLTRSGATWAGTAPASGVVLTRRANLMAEYPDGAVTLPIRFVPARPEMQFAVQNPPLLTCIPPNLTRLERAVAYSEQVDAYFKARRLAQSGDCGATNQARVVRIWFDRSFNLASENDHIAPDEEAYRQLRAYAAHRAYADGMWARLNGLTAGLDYRYQMSLASQGDYSAAAEVNAAIVERLASSEALTADAAQYQGVTEALLASDGAYLRARASTMIEQDVVPGPQ